MKNKSLVICLALLLVLAIAIPVPTWGDFGDFGGGSDYGGGDSGGSSWGGSSDYGSDSGGFFFFGGGDGSDSDGELGTGDIILAVIVIAIVYFFFIRKNKGGKGAGGKPVAPGGQRTDSSQLKPMSSYNEQDPDFQAFALTEKISNMYVQLQNAWQDKDLDPVRPYLTDTMYAQYNRQVTALKNAHKTNYVERIAVLGTELRGWYSSGSDDYIVVSLRTRINDYTRDDVSGKVVSGDPTAELYMEYEWIMTRPSGTKTKQGEGMSSVHCPSCGAPLDVNHSAQCPYCNAIITLAEHDWVLYSIKGISRRSSK